MKIINIRKEGKVILEQVIHANRFWSRLRGLLARPALKENEGLLLTPCSQIHTLGMRYPLDIIFMDKAGVVLKCVRELRPNRFSAAVKAYHTLEVASGYIERHAIIAGDQLSWEGAG